MERKRIMIYKGIEYTLTGRDRKNAVICIKLNNRFATEEECRKAIDFFLADKKSESVEEVVEIMKEGKRERVMGKRRYIRHLNKIPYDMTFYIDDINKATCHATGRQINDVHPKSWGDWWNEYVDSNGKLHYGR